MVKYIPIESGFAPACSSSDLLELRWRKSGIVADFIDPKDKQRSWRVTFDDVDFVRLLDEFYLSTEEDAGTKVGLVRDNFAYMVEGSRFYDSQSELLPTHLPDARHFRFVTGWTCLDVISHQAPQFSTPVRALEE